MAPSSAAAQLSLPFSHTVESLEHLLGELLGKPVSLALTDNSTTMLSARGSHGALSVRLHRMFLGADAPVIGEIVSYLRTRRGAMPHFRRFLRANRDALCRKAPRAVPIRTRGRFHDLAALYDEVNRGYFGGAIAAAITWGSRSPRSAVRKRTVGSYSERTNLIRINPVLDRKNVPRCYVAFIVYHEMLHAALGTAVKGTRRSIHSREFRRRERLFREYEAATAWEQGTE